MANETFNVTIGANMDVSGILGGVKQIQGAFNGLKLPANVTANMTKDFDKLKESLAKFKALSEKESFSKADIKNLNKLQGEIDELFNKISSSFNEISGKKIYLEADASKLKEVQAQIDQVKSDIQTKLSGIKIDFASAKGGTASLGLNELVDGFERGVKSSKVLSRAMEEVKQSLQLGNFGDASNQLTTIINKAGELKGASAGLLTFFNQIGLIKLDKPASDMAKTKEGAEQLKAALQLILPLFEQDSEAVQKFAAQLIALTGEKANLEQLAQVHWAEKMNEGESAARNLSGAMKETGAEAIGMAEATNRAAEEVKQLQQSTQYFFSLRNMLNLLKRGLREAVSTIKELDAAMTQTAVVTDYSVSDMWGKLPEYTTNANALGATVKDMYEATTLYYQQGLQTEQAMGIAAETMKMARIGGLEAADATDKMTAALRGFNMELNETSAQRVNDVYSNLAAKTASDTNELGTAMQRTASIAASAGMSFEGTAAFLAQAIETTREPAENIGTAMKTIVARFTELKKNPLEMTEVDGEEVSYNKVDTALQSIGVSLKDANGQFRDLDQVFLDISQRWDSLTQTQQRYIATQAAGSRQQSRFIAMMSNYERTTELMDYANNANGASSEQFGKTLDSLEAKINKFQNAWKEFLMGIMNDKVTKTVVDGATKVLNVVNSIINLLSAGGKLSLVKSLLSVTTAFTALRGTGRLVNSLMGGIGGMIDPTSSFKRGAASGALGRNSAQAINQPIVKELQSIRSLIAQKINSSNLGNNKTTGPYDEFNRFRAARKAIADMNGQGNVGDLTKQLSGLSSKSQNLLMRGNSAIFRAATGAVLNQYGKENRIDTRKGERFLNNQRKSGEITAEEYYKALQDPGLLKQAMVRAGVNQNNAAYQYVDKLDEQITTRAKEITQARYQKHVDDFKTKRPEATKEEVAAYETRMKQRYESDRWQNAVRETARRQIMPPASTFKTSGFGRGLDALGSLGTGLSQAGMGIQAFGSILTSSANPALQMFGSVLTGVGGLISGLGIGISSLVAAFTTVAESSFVEVLASQLVSASKMEEAAATTAITAGLFALVAVIAAVALSIKKHNDKIKKAAEEVSTNYKERTDKANTNISNLESWREDFARLSVGVDSNGNNINLSTEDYARYLEIARGLAEISPEIVDGYNAQGEAIINNKNAVDELLALEKERKTEAFNEYTSQDSIDALKAATDLQKQAKIVQKKQTPSADESLTNLQQGKVQLYGSAEVEVEVTPTYSPTATMKVGEEAREAAQDAFSDFSVDANIEETVVDGFEFKPQAKMREQAQKIGEYIKTGIEEQWIDEDFLEEFDINLEDLISGEDEALQKFETLGPKIEQRLNTAMDMAGDSITENTRKNFERAFSGYGEAADEFEEFIQPRYEQLMTIMSPYATDIPEEFRKYFNQGLKEIVSDANIEDPIKEAKLFASSFDVLTEKGGDYNGIMAEVADAQDRYFKDLNADKYNDFISGTDGAVKKLKDLRDSFKDDNGEFSGYAIAIREFIDNQITQIENFTTSGAENMSRALNTMVDEITAAEGTLENFNSIAEGTTYGKAASNMNQIFETATSDEHTAGEGDQVFWAGARALVGRNNLLENGKATKDSAMAQMKEVQEMLKGGQEGWDNFKIKWFDSYDAGLLKDIEGLTLDKNGWINTIDADMNPKVYEEIADKLNMSKEALIAMLNLGRQFGEISFTNIDDVRKSLATSENTIKNGKTVFVRRGSLEAEMDQQGVDINEQQKIEEDLDKNHNVDFIEEDVEKITKDNEQFTAMGIDSLDSLIKTFEATGEFTKDEIMAYAQKYEELNGRELSDTEFGELWENTIANEEYGGIPEGVNNIETILTSIENILASQRLAEGYLDKSTVESSQKWLFGGDGEDTDAQKFWQGHGSGKNGEITTSEFQKTSKDLSDFIDTSTEYVDKLRDAKEAAENRNDDTEAAKIQKEIDAYTNEQGTGLLDRAQVYFEEGTAAYNSKIQQQIDSIQNDRDVIDKGFEDLFSGITPESINTDTAQAALADLYRAAVSNSPVELTEGLMSQLETWGVDIESALKSGLITDSNGIYQAGKDAGDKANKDYTEGEQSAAENAGGTDSKEAGKKAGDKANKDYSEGQGSSTHQTAPGMPSNVPSNQSTTPAPSTPTTSEPVKVEGTSTVDTTQAQADLDTLKTKAEETQKIINKGAKFTVQTPGSGRLTKVAKAAQDLTQTSGEKTIQVKTGKVDTGSVKSAQQSIGNTEAKIKVGANVDSATASVRKLVRDTNAKTATIDIQADYSKSKWTHDVDIYVHKHDAKGEHNHGYAESVPTLGSAAKGYGQVGPKGKGGLTLTGELGYEIAWLPDENRSMILGANGPQMVNLPGNAVVWTHEQSKKIMKQKAIPAGSHAGETYGLPADDPRKNRGGGGNSTQKGIKPSKEKPKKTSKDKNKDKNDKNTTKLIKKAGKVLVWWENAARRLDSAQRRGEKAQKKLEELLRKFGTSLTTYEKVDQNYIKALQARKKIAEEEEKRAKKELKFTDRGRNANLSKTQKKEAKAAESKLKEAKAAYKKAKKTSSKKDDKTAKAALREAKKDYKKATEGRKSNSYMEAIGARQEISYEVTKKKRSKGKWKKTTETKKQKINLSKYITTDADGVYQIDQKEIDKIAKTNKSKAEAIKAAAEKQLNDLLSKQKAAEDERIKVEEELRQFYDDTYEAFNQWDKVITEAYLLGKELEKLSNLRSIYDAVEDLELSKLEAGFSSITESLPLVTDALEQNHRVMLQQAQANYANVEATWRSYQDWLHGNTALLETSKFKNSEKEQARWNANKAARDFLNQIGQTENFDYQAAVEALYRKQYSIDNYDQIKEGLDKIYEEQSNYYNAITEAYTSMAEIYKTITEYENFMADFEDTLIKGLDEQAEREIDRLDKINSSLTEAAKKLIDEVKRKLDERRQKEDNAQKEQDIAQKQQRLAMLRADTSGGHQVEIAQLEKEIADTQQDYQRTLEDQLLDRLQDQADKAAEQRERQIKLLEAQRDLAAALGTNVEEVNRLLSDPEKNWDKIQELWLANMNEDAGNITKQLNAEKFKKDFTQFLAYMKVLPGLEKMAEESKLPAESIELPTTVGEINNKMDAIITLLGTNENVGSPNLTAKELKAKGLSAQAARNFLMTQNGKAPTMKEMMDAGYTDLKELHQAGYGADAFANNNISYAKAKAAGLTNAQLAKNKFYEADALNGLYEEKIAEIAKTKSINNKQFKEIKEVANKAKIGTARMLQDLANTKGLSWADVLKAAKSAGYNKYRLALTFNSEGFQKAYNQVYGGNSSTAAAGNGAYTLNRREARRKKLTEYAFTTGGLADYTGPAWLDGTPSKPELVLNATDTKNFIALKDVLSRAVNSIGSVDGASYGDVVYDININVDKIEKDYDVDRVVDKVKKEIVKSSGYRNVTQVRNLR